MTYINFKMNPKGLTIIFVGIILIILILGIFTYFIFFSKENDFYSKDQCFFMSEAAGEAFEKWDCYTNWAESEKDITICEAIPLTSKEGLKYVNRYTCYRKVAIAIKDISICEKIPDNVNGAPFGGRDVCYKEVALEIKDPSICDTITDRFNRNSCIMGATYGALDASSCAKIDYSVDKDYCYHDVAIKTKDHSLCENIKSDRLKEECLNA